MSALLALYHRLAGALLHAQAPLLLAVRLYWGFSLARNGWGKLHHIDQIAAWFGDDLHLPFPTLNAWMAGGTELVGSILLMLGLASRPAAFAVAFTMTVAYATSDLDAVRTLSTDFFCDEGTRLGDCFTLAAPFPYWFMAVLVLVFGPGPFSVDAALLAWARRRAGVASPLPRPAA